MRNWSTNLTSFDTNSPDYEMFRLEHLINYGLDGEKIDVIMLKKHLPRLRIDPAKRRFIEFILQDA